MHLGLITVVVSDYDAAISFFVEFLQVEDFHAAGVQFLTAPRSEPYGHVAVFADIAGNRWDLIGPEA